MVDFESAEFFGGQARSKNTIFTGPAPRHRRVTAEPPQRYEIRFQPAVRRAIAQRLPEAVAAAALEFCDAAQAVNPRRVGKPLFGPLTGCHSARRGTYRILYQIDETAAWSTSSTSTTARRSTTARNSDRDTWP
jgi:mRNA interferase RelE/StbE